MIWGLSQRIQSKSGLMLFVVAASTFCIDGLADAKNAASKDSRWGRECRLAQPVSSIVTVVDPSALDVLDEYDSISLFQVANSTTPVLRCGRGTAFFDGRNYADLRINGKTYYGNPESFSIVEHPLERASRPVDHVFEQPAMCDEFVVGEIGADFFFADGQSSAATLHGVDILEPGRLLGVMGARDSFLLAKAVGRSGYVSSSLVHPTRRRIPCDYYSSPGPYSLDYSWTGTMTRSSFLYTGATDGNGIPTVAVPIGAKVRVLSLFTGRSRQLAWFEVAFKDLRGMVPACAVKLTGQISGAIPSMPRQYGPGASESDLKLGRLVCDGSSLSEALGISELPEPLPMPEDPEVLVNGRDSRNASIIYLGQQISVPASCVNVSDRVVESFISFEFDHDFVPINDGRPLAKGIPALGGSASNLAAGAAESISRSARLVSLLDSGVSPDQILLSERGNLPLRLPTIDDLLPCAKRSGCSRQLLRAIVVGVEKSKGDIVAEAEAAFSKFDSSFRPDGVDRRKCGVPDWNQVSLCLQIDEPELKLMNIIPCAEAFELAGLSAFGREFALDSIASADPLQPEPLKIALEAYSRAAVVSGPSPRASALLGDICLYSLWGAASPALTSDVCWFASDAIARVDGQVPPAEMLEGARASRLAGGRQIMLPALAAASNLRLKEAVLLTTKAMRSSLESGSQNAEFIYEGLELLARACFDLGEYDVSRQALARLPSFLAEKNQNLVAALLRKGQEDRKALALMNAGYVIGNNHYDWKSGLLSANWLSDRCRFCEAAGLINRTEQWVNRLEILRRLVARLFQGNGSAVKRFAVLESLLSSNGFSLADLPEFRSARSDCDRWLGAEVELGRSRKALADRCSSGTCKVMKDLTKGLQEKCFVSIRKGASRLEDTIPEIRTGVEEARIDLLAAQDQEEDVSIKVMSALVERVRNAHEREGLMAAAPAAEHFRKYRGACGATKVDLDHAISESLTSLQRICQSGADGSAVHRFVRYHPELRFVQHRHLKGGVVQKLPEDVSASIHALADANACKAGNCCLSRHPAVNPSMFQNEDFWDPYWAY